MGSERYDKMGAVATLCSVVEKLTLNEPGLSGEQLHDWAIEAMVVLGIERDDALNIWCAWCNAAMRRILASPATNG